MTNKSDFTKDEWDDIITCAGMAGHSILLSTKDGIFETLKEKMAIISSFEKAASKYPDNELIKSAIGDSETAAGKEAGISVIENNREAYIEDTLGLCSEVAEILKAKADEREAEEFKRWIVSIAEDVALAIATKKEEKMISKDENLTLREIAGELGIEGYIPPDR
ncbi:hypothetical protein F1737_09275 [Methanoplanus sp. FWC-SCC4]|uniref:Uncharacterized protein n=1 Tax=Methanochimaera problematica TaxID=2609417 RepID=A0AA97FCF7_9EURY|nr:hypothetical protein [Methanoplanus sp. FWC-SCC4]WOF16865.1 hypothetical protein F1737_09275 [Methanoplanus sp. FWC-SCC4]